MSNLTANFDVPQKAGDEIRIQAAAVKNYRGGAAAVVIGTGYATPLVVATTGMQFIGVYLELNDNSSGVAGTIVHGAPGENKSSFVRVARTGIFAFNQSGITQASVGAKAYFSDDNTVTTSVTAVPAGVIVTIDEQNSVAWVDISFATVTSTATNAKTSFVLAASALNTNVAGAAQTYASAVVPANSFKVGDRIRLRGQLIGTTRTSTDTCLLNLIFGSTTIAALAAAFPHATTNFLYFEFELVVQAVGASGSVVGAGLVNGGTAGATTTGLNLAATTIDTTAAQTFAIQGTFSANNTTDALTVNIFDLDIVRA